jgi:hypothetical protein
MQETEINTEEKIWYYAKPDGSKFGPYTDGELVKLLQNGILTKDDFIWMTDFESWMKIGNSIYSYYLEKTI